jgi:hypothetical protein
MTGGRDLEAILAGNREQTADGVTTGRRAMPSADSRGSLCGVERSDQVLDLQVPGGRDVATDPRWRRRTGHRLCSVEVRRVAHGESGGDPDAR